MEPTPLPVEISDVLRALHAPPRLVVYLRLVHAVACTLTERISAVWPMLHYDQGDVLLGAATHDIGKISYPNELSEVGIQHEVVGPEILLAHGFNEKVARFARTHGRWEQEEQPSLEDLLVALADALWKGQRQQRLEQRLIQLIVEQCQDEPWHTYMQLDDLASDNAREARGRLAWLV